MYPTTTENTVLLSDSYKVTHPLQYPATLHYMHDYMESRGGRYPFILPNGVHYILAHYLAKRVTMADIDEAEDFLTPHFGTNEYFPREAWERIVKVHGGRMQLRIRGVLEGTLLPVGVPVINVESTDKEIAFMPSWVEGLLQKAWYPTTVATKDFFTKLEMAEYWLRTTDVAQADLWDALNYVLHCFGYRGVSSEETAAIGGCAALICFKGSDTLPGLVHARRYYGEHCAGNSVPASEHSSTTVYGRDGEVEAFRNMIHQFGDKPVFACVADSYDLFNAIDNPFGTELREAILNMPATLVIRPDSGIPTDIIPEVLRRIANRFGAHDNGKAYAVLNKVRVLQGDGIDHNGSISAIYEAACISQKFSVENLVFGMGGGRLQAHTRDDQKFAIKCSLAGVDEGLRLVFKDPVTDPGKRSKAGYLDTVMGTNGYPEAAPGLYPDPRSIMTTLFENGRIYEGPQLADIRSRAKAAFDRILDERVRTNTAQLKMAA